MRLRYTIHNPINRHMGENHERMRYENRSYHRKVIDNTKINLKRNKPCWPLIYDVTYGSWLHVLLAKYRRRSLLFFRIHDFAFYLFAEQCENHYRNSYNDRIMMITAITDICVIIKRMCNVFVIIFHTDTTSIW